MDNIAARISEKWADGDVRGAICFAASGDVMAPHDKKTMAKLRLKHTLGRVAPISDAALLPTTQNNKDINTLSLWPLPLEVQDRDILEAISSFLTGSAGDINGMRPQHIKDLNESIQVTDHPVLFRASLCTLTKKDGGNRHITVYCGG